MTNKSIDIYRPSPTALPICQGEILSNVQQFHLIPPFPADFQGRGDDLPHTFAIVLSQDCDLEQDVGIRQKLETARENLARTQDKKDTDFFSREVDRLRLNCLSNVIMCSVLMADNAKGYYSEEWDAIKDNNHARFQYLCEVLKEEDATEQPIPPMVLDFRHCFAMRTDELYARLQETTAPEQRIIRRTVLAAPYMQHLVTRFGSHLARVALDIQHWTLSSMSDSQSIAQLVHGSPSTHSLEEVERELGSTTSDSQ